MAILLLEDFRGGEADEHPAYIGDNQSAVAQDVDYYRTRGFNRRNGSVLIASGIAVDINSLIVHQPNPLTASGISLWSLNESGIWHMRGEDVTLPTTVTPDPADTFDPDEVARGVTLHDKLFIAAYTTTSSGVLNRLHVWDGTTLRRTGLRAPEGTPSAADAGSGGVSGIRYYRMRYVVLDADEAVLRRSEPSGELEFEPSGSGASVTITRVGLIDEGETHWEVEMSPDQANWYRVATIAIATTTFSDTIDLPQHIAISDELGFTEEAVLSADIGDYSVQKSYRWLVADRDRILGAGNYADDASDADVEWTPVGTDESGVGNDERVPIDSGNRLSLDGQESGPITGFDAYDGRIFAFKRDRVYSLTQTGNRESAYLPQIVSSTYGAIANSVTEGTDEVGRAALYFVDPELGPMRLGAEGFRVLAPHLQDKFKSEVNFDATYKVVDVVYHPGRNQVWWQFSGLRQFARGCCPPADVTPDWPSFRWCYDVRTGGTSFHSMPRLARSIVFWNEKPTMTAEAGALVRCDEDGATDDYGNAFRAYVTSRAYKLRTLLGRVNIKNISLEGRSVQIMPGTRRPDCVTPSGVTLALTIIRDYGVQRSSAYLFTLDQEAEENYVIRHLDNARLGEVTAAQFEVGDAIAISQSPWMIETMAVHYDPMGSNRGN
jgi:hypothetical protein